MRGKNIYIPNSFCHSTFATFFVISGVTGDYKIMFNIEDDCVTCNSYVVFSQIKKSSQEAHFFIYVDRHGNWVVGESGSFLTFSVCRQIDKYNYI